MVPVLPNILVDILDTPQPILAGLTYKDFEQSELSPQELQQRTWIFLDKYEIKWG